MQTVITAMRLLTPTEIIEHPVVVVKMNGLLLWVPDHVVVPDGARHHDFPDKVLAPGFIDVHHSRRLRS